MLLQLQNFTWFESRKQEQEIKENTSNPLSFISIKENGCVKEKVAWRAKQQTFNRLEISRGWQTSWGDHRYSS